MGSQAPTDPIVASASTASVVATLPEPDAYGLTPDSDMFDLYRTGQRDAVLHALLRDLDVFKVCRWLHLSVRSSTTVCI
jgi:hypothetical protein